MKKFTIWTIAILMTAAFTGLLSIQFVHFFRTSNSLQQDFNENVSRSLYHVVQSLEEAEVKHYLDATTDEYTDKAVKKHSTESQSVDVVISPGDTIDLTQTLLAPKIKLNSKHGQRSLAATSEELYKQYRDRFYKSKTLLDQVALQWMRDLAGLPVDQRINFEELNAIMTSTFESNGIKYPFTYSIVDKNGKVYYSYNSTNDSINFKSIDKDKLSTFTQQIFLDDNAGMNYYICVSFLTGGTFIRNAMTLLLPSLILTLVLIAVFIVTLVLVFRQTNISLMKNDFISNMTHELKTPIASITLAAEMLNDQSIKQSPDMQKRMTVVIKNETKRLKMLVDKVLQTTLYEKETQRLNFEEVDVNAIVRTAVSTFALKVEDDKGKIISNITAKDSWILADKVHITNVVFNLMENAFKYRKQDITFIMNVRTANRDNSVVISIQDNGIGIKKEHLKHIFDKFYRVPTGNVHNVKGFGLGLAYVNAMVKAHGGKMQVESEYNTGSVFNIILPTLKQ